MKGLIRGEEVQFSGEVFKTGPIKLENKAYRPNQPIYLGVKGDKALVVYRDLALYRIVRNFIRHKHAQVPCGI